MEEGQAWVLRTDFSNEALWEEVCLRISAPQEEEDGEVLFRANVRFVSDKKKFVNASPSQILFYKLPSDYPCDYVFVVDNETMQHPEHPVLVLGRNEEDNDNNDIRTMRAIPSAIASVDNNLSICNMEFEDFAESSDEDGIFRGFPE